MSDEYFGYWFDIRYVFFTRVDYQAAETIAKQCKSRTEFDLRLEANGIHFLYDL